MNYALYTVVVGDLEVNCYIIEDTATHQAAVIDPGDDASAIIGCIEEKHLTPVAIINTHGHYDHIGADAELKKKYNVPVYVHRADAPYLRDASKNCSTLATGVTVSLHADVQLDEGDVITVGSLRLEVIHTPGHTPGGICLLVEDLLFCGDTLFCGTVGRTDLLGGNEDALFASLKKLERLPGTLRILPGHGNACTLAKERTHNPYLQ
jgi:glyoxylase-like metal-dependent hydrolase (beta-lactamase superfamily II)